MATKVNANVTRCSGPWLISKLPSYNDEDIISIVSFVIVTDGGMVKHSLWWWWLWSTGHPRKANANVLTNISDWPLDHNKNNVKIVETWSQWAVFRSKITIVVIIIIICNVKLARPLAEERGQWAQLCFTRLASSCSLFCSSSSSSSLTRLASSC